MFSKLLFIIVSFGMIGGCLLVMRQQRLEASHQTATTFQRVADQERAVWRMRAEIAHRCRPDQLLKLRQDLGETWTPFVAPSPPPTRSNQQPQSTLDDKPETDFDLIETIDFQDIELENFGG